MTDTIQGTTSPSLPPIPPDDPSRTATIARPNDDQTLPHVGIVGDTYTMLLTGKDTAGRYSLIDMYIPPQGGPPPHRHDFEEMFTLLEGAVAFTFRGTTVVLHAGETINIPANAPHHFHNETEQSARMLCLCAPAGQEEFFLAVGTQLATRTMPAPHLDEAAQAALRTKVGALAPQFRTELLVP